jgi:hypothetical protein
VALARDLEIALTLVGIGGVAHRRGDSLRAARLLGAADMLRGDVDFMLRRSDRLEFAVGYEDMVRSMQTKLGGAVFDAERAAGKALSLSEALNMAGITPSSAENALHPG